MNGPSFSIISFSGAEEDININQMLLEKLKLIPGSIVSAKIENGSSPSSPTPTSELAESVTPPQVTIVTNFYLSGIQMVVWIPD